MAREKDIQSRIQHKHDIEANWNKALNFIPKIGEIIIYDSDEKYNYPRLKIGDGIKDVNSLEFFLNTQHDKEYTADEIGAVSITEQNLTDDQKAQARTNIGAVSMEEVEELLGIEEEFSVTGDLVEFDFDVEPDTELEVISKIHRDETWGLSNKLVLYQTNSNNFVNFSDYFGGIGTTFEKNGLSATINDDNTISVHGTNSSTGFTYLLDRTYWSGALAERVYPAGTYTRPDDWIIGIRAAQYPNNVAISGINNLPKTITIPVPFRVVQLRYAIKGSATVDTTITPGMFYNSSDIDQKYSGTSYTVTFDAPVYDGEFNWLTGELKDIDGNTIAYYDVPKIKKMPGTNYFWTGFGENIVSNAVGDKNKTIIRLNEIAPEETIASICDFELRPTTPGATYCLHSNKVLPGSGGEFAGHEIPLITTKGTLSIVNSNNEIITEKYIDPLINWRGVSDTLTNKGIHKVWSEKFYFTKEPVAREEFTYDNGQTNAIYTFEFTEEDFQNVGLPAKLDDIPIVSPGLYTKDDAKNKVNSRVWGGSTFPATLSWDAAAQKYIFKVRGLYIGYIMSQLTSYTKCYLHYQLETPYDKPATFAMGISNDDKVIFTADDSDWRTYFDSGLFVSGSDDVTPNVTIFIPRNPEDACDGMINAARMLNAGISSAGGDTTVQGYSWIGEGDGTTNYTSKIQLKIDELHEIHKGGTIYLGPGTYPINSSLIIYGNTTIIGCGVKTVISQTADNTDAIILNGSNIVLKDFCVQLNGECTEITSCFFANSNNPNGDNGYPSCSAVTNLTMENIVMTGKYRFEYLDGKPILGDIYNNYKGVGIKSNGLYFNYAHIDNVHGKHLMAMVDNGGGGNYYNITSEYCKYAVYHGGVNSQYFINGHSYYVITDPPEYYVSMSDCIVYETGHFNKYWVCPYDTQHFKHYMYFAGTSQGNSYTLNTNYAGAVYGNGGTVPNYDHGQLAAQVVDLGRANIRLAAFQNIPYSIGNNTLQISGMSSLTLRDPAICNGLSGAGIWGKISSNTAFDEKGLTLSEICRYPIDKEGGPIYYKNLPSIVSKTPATEDNPIEIEIDISNRHLYGSPGIFIQFDHRYVASDFTVSYDTTGDGTYDVTKTFKNNTEVTMYSIRHQEVPYWIYRIKISFTKPLQIQNYTYVDAAFRQFTIDYNPEGLIGICNIGMAVNDYVGRTFLGECGGSLYGNVDMHQNTLKNLPAPIDDGDVVNKAYVDAPQNHIVLIDQATGLSYQLSIVDGKLIMKEEE